MIDAVEAQPVTSHWYCPVDRKKRYRRFHRGQGTGEQNVAGVGDEFGAIGGGGGQSGQLNTQQKRPTRGSFRRRGGADGLEFESHRRTSGCPRLIGHWDEKDGQKRCRTERKSREWSADPRKEPLAKPGLYRSELVLSVQNRGHGSKRAGKNFELFELFLTVTTDEQVFFNGSGRRFGNLLQHVFFELVFGNVLRGRLKHSLSPFHFH